MAEPLFKVSGLKVALPDMTRKPLIGRAPLVEILKGLDFELPRHQVTGIVGESGSGKSVSTMALLGLLPKTARIEGWSRPQWEAFTGVEGLGPDLPEHRPGCGARAVDPGACRDLAVRARRALIARIGCGNFDHH